MILRRDKVFLAVMVICVTMVVVLVIGSTRGAQRGLTRRIEEDDPAWNCRTMGNHVCGPTTTALLQDRLGQSCDIERDANGEAVEACQPGTTGDTP